MEKEQWEIEGQWKDYYKLLNLDSKAAPEEIKKAYRKLSKEYHPDKYPGADDIGKGEATEKFRLVREAYEYLGDTEKRKKYDEKWERRHNYPKPVIDPTHIQVKDVAPGESRVVFFTLKNEGGKCENAIAPKNEDLPSWMEIDPNHIDSISETETFPIRIEVQLTGEEWGKHYSATLRFYLDDQVATATAELWTKSEPISTPSPEFTYHRAHPIPHPKSLVRVIALISVIVGLLLPYLIFREHAVNRKLKNCKQRYQEIITGGILHEEIGLLENLAEDLCKVPKTFSSRYLEAMEFTEHLEKIITSAKVKLDNKNKRFLMGGDCLKSAVELSPGIYECQDYQAFSQGEDDENYFVALEPGDLIQIKVTIASDGAGIGGIILYDGKMSKIAEKEELVQEGSLATFRFSYLNSESHPQKIYITRYCNLFNLSRFTIELRIKKIGDDQCLPAGDYYFTPKGGKKTHIHTRGNVPLYFDGEKMAIGKHEKYELRRVKSEQNIQGK